ncbi:hypothetical protein CerSpe_090790 [Prunus speciosa]
MQCKKLFYVSQIIGSLAGWVLEHASVKLLELGPQQPKSKACRRATWEDPERRKARLRLRIVKDDEQKPDSEKSDCVRLVGCVGKFGKMMLEMLPEDLAFTVFVPSEEAFERDLRLSSNESLVGEKMNDDTYAIMSRVLGFSAMPRRLASVNVPIDKELSYDSISGFVLYISKEEDGALTVNRVRSKRVDLRKKGSVVHIMDGVIMDAEFQQSVQPEEQD